MLVLAGLFHISTIFSPTDTSTTSTSFQTLLLEVNRTEYRKIGTLQCIETKAMLSLIDVIKTNINIPK